MNYLLNISGKGEAEIKSQFDNFKSVLSYYITAKDLSSDKELTEEQYKKISLLLKENKNQLEKMNYRNFLTRLTRNLKSIAKIPIIQNDNKTEFDFKKIKPDEFFKIVLETIENLEKEKKNLKEKDYKVLKSFTNKNRFELEVLNINEFLREIQSGFSKLYYSNIDVFTKMAAKSKNLDLSNMNTKDFFKHMKDTIEEVPLYFMQVQDQLAANKTLQKFFGEDEETIKKLESEKFWSKIGSFLRNFFNYKKELLKSKELQKKFNMETGDDIHCTIEETTNQEFFKKLIELINEICAEGENLSKIKGIKDSLLNLGIAKPKKN